MESYPAREKYTRDYASYYAKDRFQTGVARREARIVARLLERCGPLEAALDAPCGAGRLTPLLRAEKVTALDISEGMVAELAERTGVEGVVGDIFALPFEDASYDLALSVRFLHHLPDLETLRDGLAELARVSRRWVLVSYFDSFALQSLRRAIKNRVRARPQHRIARPWREFSAVAKSVGLLPVERACSAPGVSEHWFALFERGGPQPA